MARGRLISTEIWKSETIVKLGYLHRLQWIGLITTADDQGRGRAHPGLIRSAIFPLEDIDLETIETGMQAFADEGLITIYEGDGKQLYQITNWWEDGHQGGMRWAWPSKYPAPDGWADRLHYRQGNKVVEENWRESPDDSDGEDNCPPDDSDLTVEPPRNHDDTSAEPAPNINGNSNSNGNDVPKNSPEGGAPPPPPASPPPKSPKPKRASNPPPAAVKVFRANAHRYPAKAWYSDVEQAVGDDQANLDLWGSIVKAWVGLGWNPTNVSGMLEFYGRREIPAVKGGNGRSGSNRASRNPNSRITPKPPAAPVDPVQIERDRASLRAHRARQRGDGGRG